MKKKEKLKGLITEFKKFISRGSVIDMAVGVVMGSAFSAIVTAFTNILLSVCTWGVPGGINGLVTVLPALNDAQKGLDAANGLGQFFDKANLSQLAADLAIRTYGETEGVTAAAIANAQTTITNNYTLHGTTYTYNMSAVIDWGSFINAIISFLIIALTLFIILKVYQYSKKKREEYKLKLEEEYYKKHPEERPVEAEPELIVTELDILKEIRDELKAQNKQEEKIEKVEEEIKKEE